jgi:thiosulfate dehydrogenase
MRTVVTTLVVACLAVLLLGFVAIKEGIMPANADADPGGLEHWAAKASLKATMKRGMRELKGPDAPGDSVMTAGVKLYRTHCLVCHGAADAKASSVAKGLYQKPPQFGKDDVTDDPVEMTYWKITHGIRFTGMPSYHETLTDNERWAIASFLRHQDSLPPNALAAWKSLPSAATDSALRGVVQK